MNGTAQSGMVSCGLDSDFSVMKSLQVIWQMRTGSQCNGMKLGLHSILWKGNRTNKAQTRDLSAYLYYFLSWLLSKNCVILPIYEAKRPREEFSANQCLHPAG